MSIITLTSESDYQIRTQMPMCHQTRYILECWSRLWYTKDGQIVQTLAWDYASGIKLALNCTFRSSDQFQNRLRMRLGRSPVPAQMITSICHCKKGAAIGKTVWNEIWIVYLISTGHEAKDYANHNNLSLARWLESVQTDSKVLKFSIADRLWYSASELAIIFHFTLMY